MSSDRIEPKAVEAKPPVSLDRARRYFLESSNATADNDKLCLKDADYFHGQQLSAEVRTTLKARGQPPVVVNRIAPAINGVLGIVDTAKSAPECFPRNAEDTNSADVGTKLLRYLGDKADMARIMRMSSEDFFIHGTCAAFVGEGITEGDKQIPVTRIAWEDFFYDPLSRNYDFSDATYLGIAKWLDAGTVKALYPETYGKLGDPYDTGSWLDGKHDIEDQRIWVDRERRRIRVVELYFRDDGGVWQRMCFCQAGILDFGKSAYKDDEGRSICPIVAVSYELNRQTGDRYGAIRNAIPLQDEINSRRSRLLTLTHNRRVRQVDDGIDPKSKEIARKEAAKADGVMPLGFDMVTSSEDFQGNVLLLQQSERDFDRLFPTPAVLSRFGSGDSGRARQIMQQAGYTEWSRALDRLNAFETQIYRRLFFAARQFMTAPTVIRITDEVRAPKFAQVNIPILGMAPAPIMDPQTGQPIIDPMTGQPQMAMQETIVGYENEVAKMDLDIVLEMVADTVTLEQEAMAEILRYAASTGTSILDPNFEMLLHLSPLPDKTKTIERWKAAYTQLQGDVQQQQMQQMEQIAAQTKLQELEIQALAAKNTAQARKADAEAVKTEQEVYGQQQQLAFLNSITPPPHPLG